MGNELSKKQGVCALLAGLYMALAYLVGIVIFLFILKYPEITSVEEKILILKDMGSMVFLTNMMMYILFGPVLVIFLLALKSSLNLEKSLLVKLSVIVGFIWAGSLTACGMIGNAAIAPALKLYQANTAEGILFWQTIETVTAGIGNGNGEILGGIMTLGLGIAMLKANSFKRALAVFGIVVGSVGIISVIPELTDLVGLFGILQLLWFIFTGITVFKINKGVK